MRRYFGWALASLIALGFGGSTGAMAADMAVKAPAYGAAPYGWTGWYVGLNAGGILNDSNYQADPAGCFLTGCGVGGVAANPFRTFTGNFRDAAFTGGGQVGYNRQMGTWLWGFEADINYSGINQTNSASNILTGPLVGAIPLTSVQERLDWFGTVRGRVGFLATPNLLLYGTGGLAYGHVSSSTGVLFPVTCCGGDNYVGNASSTRVGWTAGGGAEWALGQNWSIKAEYLYIDLGSFSYADPCVTPGAVCGAPGPAYQTRVTTRDHVARAGINYHFGAPFVSKY